MAKTERIFPLSTIGGRIQNLRRAKEISRAEFYDLVYGEGLASDVNSKNKTVMNWESGKSQAFTPDVLKCMCEVLDCDADYLVGSQDVPRKEYGHIAEMTGLSYEASKYLINLKERGLLGIPTLTTISDLLSQANTQENESGRSLLIQLVYFRCTDYFPELRDKRNKGKEAGREVQSRDYDADWGALIRELTRFTDSYRLKRFHTD